MPYTSYNPYTPYNNIPPIFSFPNNNGQQPAATLRQGFNYNNLNSFAFNPVNYSLNLQHNLLSNKICCVFDFLEKFPNLNLDNINRLISLRRNNTNLRYNINDLRLGNNNSLNQDQGNTSNTLLTFINNANAEQLIKAHFLLSNKDLSNISYIFFTKNNINNPNLVHRAISMIDYKLNNINYRFNNSHLTGEITSCNSFINLLNYSNIQNLNSIKGILQDLQKEYQEINSFISMFSMGTLSNNYSAIANMQVRNLLSSNIDHLRMAGQFGHNIGAGIGTHSRRYNNRFYGNNSGGNDEYYAQQQQEDLENDQYYE